MASMAPGSGTLYALSTIVLCAAFTITGRYAKLEKLSRIMALALVVMAVIAASAKFPGLATLGQGLVPNWPEGTDNYILLPWIGTILAGSMGIVWFGYWTAARGFGGGLIGHSEAATASDLKTLHREPIIAQLKRWIATMTLTAVLAVTGGFMVLLSFLILGAELLAPNQLMPEGPDVAVDLARLFSAVWGAPGKYLLLVCVTVAIGGSILANQDGWGRSFADMTKILLGRNRDQASQCQHGKLGSLSLSRLKKLYIAIITGIIPVIIILIFPDPVKVMSASGIIAAAHTPFIAAVALRVNRTQLPKELAPGLLSSAFMAAAACAYFLFALVYLKSLIA